MGAMSLEIHLWMQLHFASVALIVSVLGELGSSFVYLGCT